MAQAESAASDRARARWAARSFALVLAGADRIQQVVNSGHELPPPGGSLASASVRLRRTPPQEWGGPDYLIPERPSTSVTIPSRIFSPASQKSGLVMSMPMRLTSSSG